MRVVIFKGNLIIITKVGNANYTVTLHWLPLLIFVPITNQRAELQTADLFSRFETLNILQAVVFLKMATSLSRLFLREFNSSKTLFKELPTASAVSGDHGGSYY